MKTVTPRTTENAGRARILERPDGFYWQDGDGLEYGPFATLAEAEADMESASAAADDDAAPEPLEEAERDVGMPDWLDPETGEPGEQFAPRIEDH